MSGRNSERKLLLLLQFFPQKLKSERRTPFAGMSQGFAVRAGFEPAITGMKIQRPRPLDERTAKPCSLFTVAQSEKPMS